MNEKIGARKESAAIRVEHDRERSEREKEIAAIRVEHDREIERTRKLQCDLASKRRWRIRAEHEKRWRIYDMKLLKRGVGFTR